jgi:hypothetical protein
VAKRGRVQRVDELTGALSPRTAADSCGSYLRDVLRPRHSVVTVRVAVAGGDSCADRLGQPLDALLGLKGDL